MRRKTGYSLLEMMLVVSLSTALMSVISLMILSASWLQGSTQTQLAMSRTLSLWEMALRSDVHQSFSAQISEGELQLRGSDQRSILWALREHKLERTEWEGDHRLAIEAWPLPPNSQITWEPQGAFLYVSLIPITEVLSPEHQPADSPVELIIRMRSESEVLP